MNEAKEMARITNLHYLFDEYNEDPKAIESIMSKDLPDWKFIQGNRGVMLLEKDNRRVISVKGTDPKHAGDLLSDVALATGLHKANKQFIDRKNQIKNIMRESKDKEVSLVGHSLGASIISNAMATSPSVLRNTTQAYLFNQGSTPIFEATLNPKKENITMMEEKTKHYKHSKDIISKTAGKYGETFLIRKTKKGVSPHSITNWL